MEVSSQQMFFPRLKDKVVLITGASAGIGEATARLFAASGSHLIIGARRVDRLLELKARIEAAHPSARVHVCELDITNAGEIKRVIDSLPPSFASIDILVNNAGLALGADQTHETTEEQVNIVIDTNVKGVLFVIQAVVPGMVARGKGHVINVSSIAAHEAYKGGSIYCASKHAVKAITTSLRKELFATPIRVSSVSPGIVRTEFSKVRFGDEAKAKNVYEGLPLGPLEAEDIAEDIAYIASRPDRVQVADIITLATNQGSTEFIFRNPTS